MSPELIEGLKYVGAAIGVLISGMTGAKINERRNSGDNGKYVREKECLLRHANEKELRELLIENYNEIKQDIRSINQQLSGG